MNSKFVLRKDKKTQEGYFPILLKVSGNGILFKKNINNVKVLEKHWDATKQRVLPSKKNEEYNYHIEFNKKLDQIEFKLKELFRYNRLNDRVLTKDDVLLKLNDNEQNFVLKYNFFDSFDEFINKNKATKVERTIKGYVTTKNFFKSFNDDVYPFNFNDINFTFFDELQGYSFNIRKTKNNYFAKLISIFKTFMSWAEDRGHHKNEFYTKFKAREEEVEVIYLNYDELMLLYNHKFESEKLEKVRDVYCFSCFTGLRYSDVKALKPSSIKEDNIILNIQKTKTLDHKIPINKYAKAILDKYEKTIYYPLPVISNQKFNDYLKDCCRDAGIKTEITITRYIGHKRVDKTAPKYDLITSHTARKTFVTNSLILGMSESVVKSITGHKKDNSFRKYVNIAEEVKTNEMNKVWS